MSFPIQAAFRTAVVEQDATTKTGSIMWMPAGSHMIKATRGGKPFTGRVEVYQNAVPRLASALQAMHATADEGQGSRPFFDFNHDGEAASAWVKAFRWVDKEGIFADVEWSDVGFEAVKGRAYRYFSPQFLFEELDAHGSSGQPAIPKDMFCLGGLVNAPAFQRIHEVAAMHAEQTVSAARVTSLESEMITLKAENESLRIQTAKAIERAASARVDAELAGIEGVTNTVKASLAKTLLTDEAGALETIASLKANRVRHSETVIVSTDHYAATESDLLTRHMQRLGKSRN